MPFIALEICNESVNSVFLQMFAFSMFISRLHRSPLSCKRAINMRVVWDALLPFQIRNIQYTCFNVVTRMHSSRMRTGRSLTVFRSLLLPGEKGVYLPGPGGVCTCLVPGGCTWSRGCVPDWSRGGVPAWSRGCVYLPGPGGCLVRYSPLWTEWMTDRCKNITLAKTSFRPVIRLHRLLKC